MARKMRTDNPLAVHTFKGSRFDDHGIDLSVLPEFAQYQKIVIETAKDIWRQEHPYSNRLQNNFEDEHRLKIYQINAGSVSIPIYRESPLLIEGFDLLGRAVNLVHLAIDAVGKKERIPSNFPKRVLSYFSGYGKTLAEGERIEMASPTLGTITNFSAETREEFEKRCLESYTDHIDLLARVSMARVSKPRMSILLDDGEEIDAPLNEDDKSLVISALEQFNSIKVRIVGRGSFSPDGTLTKIIEIKKLMLAGTSTELMATDRTPFWQKCISLGTSIPKEEWDKVPKDSAEKFDQYFYGQGS